ncbi:class I SAM-dependent methyltransferase [Paenibacillus albicereus]|uniref:Class I SAM-dependent methyltransferase n=2 Tax=Paenibacillus albicereus TaxID=2726185 RepID=A0A6H2GTX9_9BACL|nr:class I SAM-dependent methyltransferase [Paenibacillus albicereus]
MDMDSKERFSSRVEDYVKFRPGYPAEAIDAILEQGGLAPESAVADIGAGTGIFSGLLMERGLRVMAIEPNADMARAAWTAHGPNELFGIMLAPAEDTGLASESLDAIVCAQSFHWFDQEAAKAEFARILKPDKRAFLVWNSRLTAGTPFLERYEALLHEYGTDYASVNHRNISPERLQAFFREGTLTRRAFPNRQRFDYEGVKGRLLSSSYAPQAGDPRHEPMLAELRRIFDETQQDGTIDFDYETEVFSGEV